jgi:serine/threonine protein kinase
MFVKLHSLAFGREAGLAGEADCSSAVVHDEGGRAGDAEEAGGRLIIINNLQFEAMEKKRTFNPQKYYNEKADFTYLKEFGYEVTKELGRGGYGVVYKGKRIANDQPVAIKINFNTVARELIYNEIAFLKLVQGGAQFPKVLDLFIHTGVTHIVLEYY